jgi:hypothetical protein
MPSRMPSSASRDATDELTLVDDDEMSTGGGSGIGWDGYEVAPPSCRALCVTNEPTRARSGPAATARGQRLGPGGPVVRALLVREQPVVAPLGQVTSQHSYPAGWARMRRRASG